MEIFTTVKELSNCLKSHKNEGKSIGFVPTMGALHKGHLSLLETARKENTITVSSIFVNPLQFNDKNDLEKYPRTLEGDIHLLKSAKCDVVFIPSVKEVYPVSEISEEGKAGSNPGLDLGTLDKVMEGKYRPGHFQGVCTVVKRLFDIVKPDNAYFGEKDFQQLAVIKHMVKILGLRVTIRSCPTLRESDGLAMSSRNVLLSPDQRRNASLIFKTLQEVSKKIKKLPPDDLQKWVKEKIDVNPFLQLEYFEIVDPETLLPVISFADKKNLRACIAVKAGAVRLIDNISL